MGKEILHTVTVAWILLGLCLWYLVSGTNQWYYVWDKGKDLLLFIWLLQYVRGQYRPALIALTVFFLIRLAWEALAIPNYKTASGKEYIDILFAVDLGIIVLLYLYGLYKNNRKSGRD